MTEPESEITRLRGLGKACAGWLAAIGVHTEAELRAMGPVTAYRLVALRGYRPSLNFLYAMESALRDLHWAALPADVKARLRAELEAPWDAREWLDVE